MCHGHRPFGKFQLKYIAVFPISSCANAEKALKIGQLLLIEDMKSTKHSFSYTFSTSGGCGNGAQSTHY
jgi:hypothetical protein